MADIGKPVKEWDVPAPVTTPAPKPIRVPVPA